VLNARRVLFLSPHTDDSELGCGGTIARMIEEGVQVFVAAFSTVGESVPAGWPPDTLRKEFYQAAAALKVPRENVVAYDYPVRRLSPNRQEILEELVKLRREIKPDMAFLPSGHDLHQDHQVVYAEGLRAFKDISLLGYELPWNHIMFSADAFVVLQKHHIECKWQALEQYRSQFELQRPYFARDFIEGLARVRGTAVKTNWAEAFEVIRIRW
jgi:N-acetylglucosamine malate deacetylase 1